MSLTVMVYSEAGGVTKTTTAVSLAVSAARRGIRTTLMDLDPRCATTKWTGLVARKPGEHAGSLLTRDDAPEWADMLAQDSPWSDFLRVIPSHSSLTTLEESLATNPGAELRLRRAISAIDSDLVVLDLPNRSGGTILRNALPASDRVVYASTLTPDGIDGVECARESISKWLSWRSELGAPAALTEAGIIAGAWHNPQIPSRIDRAGIARLRETGLLLEPIVPHRVIVQECRATHTWYGDFDAAAPVADAYTALLDQVIA